VSSTSDQSPQIVVAVDGSPSSEQALRWAVRQAAATGAEVHAVHAWHLPDLYGWGAVIDDVDWAENARLVLDRALAEALEPAVAAGVHRHVVEGHATQVLLDAAADADLLVVGSRGHGGFAGMLLGSVSQHVVAHAACPVVVVRTTPQRVPAAEPNAVLAAVPVPAT